MQLLKRKKQHNDLDASEKDLLRQLFDAKMALDSARQKFEYVTEPDMVASCIYEMHAEQARYAHLLGRVRAQGISLENRRLLEDRGENQRLRID